MHKFLPQVWINSRFRSNLTLSGRFVEGESSPTPSQKLPESHGICHSRSGRGSMANSVGKNSPSPPGQRGERVKGWVIQGKLDGKSESRFSPDSPALSWERRLAAVTRREFSLHFWPATKSVRRTETANNSCSSLLFRLRGCRRPSISVVRVKFSNWSW